MIALDSNYLEIKQRHKLLHLTYVGPHERHYYLHYPSVKMETPIPGHSARERLQVCQNTRYSSLER